jgi:hypothetical protein
MEPSPEENELDFCDVLFGAAAAVQENCQPFKTADQV